jgi:predicted nucleic acid-binding protein
VQVRSFLEAYEDAVAFYSRDVCFEDARKYIPDLASRRNLDPTFALSVLDQIERIVEPVDRSLYEAYEEIAHARISSRDVEDWPVVATALLLDGRKTRIFSAVVWQPGLPTESNFICEIHKLKPLD